MRSKRSWRVLICLVGILILLSIVPFRSHAAVPLKINYQGSLTDSGGTPINGTKSIVFSIYDVSSGGSALWSETQNVTVTNGVFSVNLGDVNPINLSTLPFDKQYYLGVKVGADIEMTPRRLFTSAGYAFRSELSGTSCPGTSANDIMVKVGPVCVDKYEASVWSSADGTGTQYGASSDDYPSSFPDTGNYSTALYAVSKAGVTPSANITWFQAQQACALSGKRLLTNAEWQMAAAGTPDPGASGNNTANYCNTNRGAAVNTGSSTGGTQPCISNWGVYDMVGNLEEWVADWIQDNSDADGGSTTSATYGDDVLTGIDEGTNETDRFPAALIRGGSWSHTTNAGVFALAAGAGPSTSYLSLGFRCAR